MILICAEDWMSDNYQPSRPSHCSRDRNRQCEEQQSTLPLRTLELLVSLLTEYEQTDTTLRQLLLLLPDSRIVLHIFLDTSQHVVPQLPHNEILKMSSIKFRIKSSMDLFDHNGLIEFDGELL